MDCPISPKYYKTCLFSEERLPALLYSILSEQSKTTLIIDRFIRKLIVYQNYSTTFMIPIKGISSKQYLHSKWNKNNKKKTRFP